MTKDEILEFIKANAGKMTIKEMAYELKMNDNTLYWHAKKNNISVRAIRGETIKEFVKRNAGLMTAPKMAESFCCRLNSVHAAASKMGISLAVKRNSPLDDYLLAHGAGRTVREIAKETGCSIMQVYNRCNQLRIPFKRVGRREKATVVHISEAERRRGIQFDPKSTEIVSERLYKSWSL